MADNSRPPPTARPQRKRARLLANFEKAAVDETAIEKRRVASENLYTFDYQSAAVIKRRANARLLFEAYVKVTYIPAIEPTEGQIWNLDTIIERTKDVIFTYASVAQGQIGDKPKAGVLFQLKDGIYW